MENTSDAMQRFNAFANNFKETQLWMDMRLTVENSPWHREANVAVHTEMLDRWYLENLASNRNDKQRMLTRVACLYHDVGKPPSEIQKYSEERGHYRAYHGHEQISARIWVDYATQNMSMVETLLGFTLQDISNVAMMIEYHVPFDLKNKDKRKALKRAIMLRMGESGHQAWLDMLLSDQHGRISDGQAEKLAKVDEWMKEWELVEWQ